MGKIKDISGQKFGRLNVIKYAYTDKRHTAIWQCKCDCGNIVEVRGDALRNGTIQSCGCLQEDRRKEALTKHGQSRSKLYKVYHSMKGRCYNKNNREYHNYGARGIAVYSEWLSSYETFYDWAIENGYQDGLTIDRIDVNKGYEPDNCRWVNNKTQQNNKRNNIYLTCNNKTQTLMQWANELNLTYSCIHNRYERGWNIKEILFGRQKNA